MLWLYQRVLFIFAVLFSLVLGTVRCGPLRRTAQRCSNDAVVRALQRNGSGGVAYCKALAGRGATVTEMAVSQQTLLLNIVGAAADGRL